MKQGTVLAPVIDLKRGGSADDRQIIDTPPHIAAGLKVRAVCVSVTQVFVRVSYVKCVLIMCDLCDVCVRTQHPAGSPRGTL